MARFSVLQGLISLLLLSSQGAADNTVPGATAACDELKKTHGALVTLPADEFEYYNLRTENWYAFSRIYTAIDKVSHLV
jgi:hypothetical protein